ncbi:MAG: AraC family transcriptional regulator [Akkermansiaceae bacterium]|nr:AraC family transcriptional regulator [Akkermansiaceae bacterium]
MVDIPMNCLASSQKSGGSAEALFIAGQLESSAMFRNYASAFRQVTGLPLGIAVGDSWWCSEGGWSAENPFYQSIIRHREACECCKLRCEADTAGCDGSSRTMTCFTDLCESCVAIPLGEDIPIFLRPSGILFEAPSHEKFEKIMRHLTEHPTRFDERVARSGYFDLKVSDPLTQGSIIILLEFFASQLVLPAKDLILRFRSSEIPNIRRACQYVMEHREEALTLGEVAKVANMSSYYFCRKFKECTSLTFTEYVNRVRIDGAKERLRTPRVQVSEVACESGFSSIAHFNRTFRRIVGCSPREFRVGLLQVHGGKHARN